MSSYRIICKNDKWIIKNDSQDSCFDFTITCKEGVSTPLLVSLQNDPICCTCGEVGIESGQRVAIDEKFSVELVNGSLNNLKVFINEEEIKPFDDFNKIFKNGAAEVANNLEVENDPEVENDRGFGLYSIVLKQNDKVFPPLLLERYPGFKIGFDFCGKKLACAKDRYQAAGEFFKTMADSLRDSNLALSLLDPASIASSSGASKEDPGREIASTKTEPRTALTDYWFFVKHEKTIENSLKHIRRIPHKVLGQKKEFLRIENVTQYTPDLPYEISKAPQYFQPSENNGICSIEWKSYTPEKVLVSILDETYDNPENRFILHVVDMFLAKLRKVEECFSKNEDKIKKIRVLINTLKMFKRHPDFRHLQRSPVEPKQSKVLTKTPGYKDIAKIWRQYGGIKFNKGLLFLDALIRQKKWHELYELWCYQLLIEKLKANEMPQFSTIYKKDGKGSYLTSKLKFQKDGKQYILLYQPTINKCDECDVRCYHSLPDETNQIKLEINCKKNNVKEEMRPDFMLLEYSDKKYCLCWLIDAKFKVIDKMNYNNYFIGNIETAIEKYFIDTVKDIEDKYLNKYSIDGHKLPGCGIFLSNEEKNPARITCYNDNESDKNCISAAIICDDMKIQLRCEKHDCAGIDCVLKIKTF